jgi:hypothetical protein
MDCAMKLNEPHAEFSSPWTCRITGLQLRPAVCEQDIITLAETEIYGDRRTDVEQVLAWWRAYPQGNLLAVLHGKIVGGIDIWPVAADFYDGFMRRGCDETALTPARFALHHTPGQTSHWYVGSISMQRVLPARQQRMAMLHLLTGGIAYWETLIPDVPARICAESWTDEGRNLLSRLGWTPAEPGAVSAQGDTLFEYVLTEWAQSRDQQALLQKRVAA